MYRPSEKRSRYSPGNSRHNDQNISKKLKRDTPTSPLQQKKQMSANDTPKSVPEKIKLFLMGVSDVLHDIEENNIDINDRMRSRLIRLPRWALRYLLSRHKSIFSVSDSNDKLERQTWRHLRSLVLPVYTQVESVNILGTLANLKRDLEVILKTSLEKMKSGRKDSESNKQKINSILKKSDTVNSHEAEPHTSESDDSADVHQKNNELTKASLNQDEKETHTSKSNSKHGVSSSDKTKETVVKHRANICHKKEKNKKADKDSHSKHAESGKVKDIMQDRWQESASQCVDEDKINKRFCVQEDKKNQHHASRHKFEEKGTYFSKQRERDSSCEKDKSRHEADSSVSGELKRTRERVSYKKENVDVHTRKALKHSDTLHSDTHPIKMQPIVSDNSSTCSTKTSEKPDAAVLENDMGDVDYRKLLRDKDLTQQDINLRQHLQKNIINDSQDVDMRQLRPQVVPRTLLNNDDQRIVKLKKDTHTSTSVSDDDHRSRPSKNNYHKLSKPDENLHRSSDSRDDHRQHRLSDDSFRLMAHNTDDHRQSRPGNDSHRSSSVRSDDYRRSRPDDSSRKYVSDRSDDHKRLKLEDSCHRSTSRCSDDHRSSKSGNDSHRSLSAKSHDYRKTRPDDDSKRHASSRSNDQRRSGLHSDSSRSTTVHNDEHRHTDHKRFRPEADTHSLNSARNDAYKQTRSDDDFRRHSSDRNDDHKRLDHQDDTHRGTSVSNEDYRQHRAQDDPPSPASIDKGPKPLDESQRLMSVSSDRSQVRVQDHSQMPISVINQLKKRHEHKRLHAKISPEIHGHSKTKEDTLPYQIELTLQQTELLKKSLTDRLFGKKKLPESDFQDNSHTLTKEPCVSDRVPAYGQQSTSLLDIGGEKSFSPVRAHSLSQALLSYDEDSHSRSTDLQGSANVEDLRSKPFSRDYKRISSFKLPTSPLRITIKNEHSGNSVPARKDSETPFSHSHNPSLSSSNPAHNVKDLLHNFMQKNTSSEDYKLPTMQKTKPLEDYHLPSKVKEKSPEPEKPHRSTGLFPCFKLDGYTSYKEVTEDMQSTPPPMTESSRVTGATTASSTISSSKLSVPSSSLSSTSAQKASIPCDDASIDEHLYNTAVFSSVEDEWLYGDSSPAKQVNKTRTYPISTQLACASRASSYHQHHDTTTMKGSEVKTETQPPQRPIQGNGNGKAEAKAGAAGIALESATAAQLLNTLKTQLKKEEETKQKLKELLQKLSLFCDILPAAVQRLVTSPVAMSNPVIIKLLSQLAMRAETLPVIYTVKQKSAELEKYFSQLLQSVDI